MWPFFYDKNIHARNPYRLKEKNVWSRSIAQDDQYEVLDTAWVFHINLKGKHLSHLIKNAENSNLDQRGLYNQPELFVQSLVLLFGYW